MLIVNKFVQCKDCELHAVGADEVETWIISKGLTATRKVEIAHVGQGLEAREHSPRVVNLSANRFTDTGHTTRLKQRQQLLLR